MQGHEGITPVDSIGSGFVRAGMMLKLPQNAPEEAEGATNIVTRKSEPSKEQVQVVAISLEHGGGRIPGGAHGLGDDFGQEFEFAGGGGRNGWVDGGVGGRLGGLIARDRDLI
jgi:hypothetical protein